MSNPVGDLIHDVAFRLGNPKMIEPMTHAAILRAMRRVYKRLNHNCNPIEKLLECDFSSTGGNDSLSDGYFALPSDWIRPYKIDPYCDFRQPEVFDDSESRTFTIHRNRIYFANVGSSSDYDVFYASVGDTLVDAEDADVGTDEVNEPEYPDHLQDILLYGTCLELSSSYELFKMDWETFKDMKVMLSEVQTLKQLVTPETSGPQERKLTVDAYGEALIGDSTLSSNIVEYIWKKVALLDVETEQTLLTGVGELIVANLDTEQGYLPDFVEKISVEIGTAYQDRTAHITTPATINAAGEVTFRVTLSPRGAAGVPYFDLIVRQL